MSRLRSGLAGLLLGGLMAAASAAPPGATAITPVVAPGRVLDFPRDHGSHPDYRTEWWYATGWLKTAGGETLGFQVTFFRTRTQAGEGNPSAFAARQFVIAHAAISDPRRGRLWHDQKSARAVFGLAGADEHDTRVWLDDWRFERREGRYQARLKGRELDLELALAPTRAPMLNGVAGYSQKGPDPRSASYYYSQPQLRVDGEIRRGERRDRVTGQAWLDHEWSQAVLDADSTGWDWVGINLADGGALMAFRLRDRRGAQRWAAATLARPDGTQQVFGPDEIAWQPLRRWRSPRTGIEYPVTWTLRVGGSDYALSPLLDDQESDSRATTGAIYWEGAIRLEGHAGLRGQGYLELTGYGEALQLP